MRKSKTDDALECPFVKRKCLREKCVGWQSGPLNKEINGQEQLTLHSDCFVIWDLLYKKAIANRADGTQVSIDKLRQEVGHSNVGMLALIKNPDAQRRLLGS